MVNEMKKIIIVNNNMKIGGVQKSLCNLLWAIKNDYDVTLLLFKKKGELLSNVPPSVRVVEVSGPFRDLGVSQGECKGRLTDYIMRGTLAFLSRWFGRSCVLQFMLKRQPKLSGNYDCAISFLHNGRRKSFYGGTQEYVLHCVDAHKKVAFLHGDYINCGANHKENDRLMELFDTVAACSDGCRLSLEKAIPQLSYKCRTVCNFHNFDEIRHLASIEPIEYDVSCINVIVVARLSHEKGIDRAIRAVSLAVTHGYRIKLHVVGDGPLREELVKLVEKAHISDDVIFYGAQSNPYRYMKNADLLLITSHHEAAPMVIDEALCLGIPTFTTRTTSSEDMVEKRHCGWVCENNQNSLNRMQ